MMPKFRRRLYHSILNALYNSQLFDDNTWQLSCEQWHEFYSGIVFYMQSWAISIKLTQFGIWFQELYRSNSLRSKPIRKNLKTVLSMVDWLVLHRCKTHGENICVKIYVFPMFVFILFEYELFMSLRQIFKRQLFTAEKNIRQISSYTHRDIKDSLTEQMIHYMLQ